MTCSAPVAPDLRHARETVSPFPSIVHTKDGRWVMANLGTRPGDVARLIDLLKRHGMETSLNAESANVPQGGRFVPGTGPETAQAAQGSHPMEAVQRFVRAFTYANVPWREAQEVGMLWAPLRNRTRTPLIRTGSPATVVRTSNTQNWGRSFRYATSKWLGTATSWSVGPSGAVLKRRCPDCCHAGAAHRTGDRQHPGCTAVRRLSPHGKPFPLHGIRILDFTWFLASAGGTRFLSAFGAESIKVELKSHPDTRMAAMALVGGRAAREQASAPARRHRP